MSAALRTLSLVEKGWAGARWLSLDLARNGGSVRHLIKGRLPRATREVLTPCRGVSLAGVPQRLFRPAAWAFLCAGQLGGIDLVITDNAKTAGWVKKGFPLLADKVLLIGETESGRPRVVDQGASVRLP